MKPRVPVTLLVLAFTLPMCGSTLADLESDFRNPPAAARPWVYWFVMDGNLTREGITADFEAMKQAGIGGLIMMEVDVGIPKGPVGFMSREWQQLFAHAVKEAERLGLQMTLNAGPGWTGSGGPWVKPEQSMQHLVASSVEVSGPRQYGELLPLPKRRPAFFGDGGLPPELEKARNDFYRDVAVLAFPTPAGEARIADLDEKALYVRAPYSSQPGVKPFLPTAARYDADNPATVAESKQILDLTERLAPDGRLDWNVPAGNWTILRFGSRSTGANTRPAPAPGIGLESDKFDARALDAHFDAFVRTLLRAVRGAGEAPRRRGEGGGSTPDVVAYSRTPKDAGSTPDLAAYKSKGGWTSLHIDSWEMGAQNWTAAFRTEFRERRGYDPFRYFPVLTGRIVDSREISERFLWDLRQTAQELVLRNHAEHLKELGRREGLGLSIEPYDMNPCADLSLGALADVPMCEFWLYGFNTSFSVLEAASIAHTCGRPIVAAEAFTSSDAERWQAYPGSMKALGDWAFCAGVNRLVFHRYQHQPWLDRRPGMTMGPYGVHWERTQTWWDLVPAYHQYLTRCQFMLRRGLPVADVCFLAAEGAPQVFRPPPSATRGNPPDRLGYNFDGCAPETLLARMSVKKGQLVLPDGVRYRVLVLPESETMTPRLLRKIKALVEAGATIIGPKPAKSPSLSGYPACDAEVRQLASEVWGECDGVKVREHKFGRGRVIWERPLSADAPAAIPPPSSQDQYGDFGVASRTLESMGVIPDFESDEPLRYVHRRDGGLEIYFVANPEDRTIEARCTFRVERKRPELWDPVAGSARALTEFTARQGSTAVPLRFAPHQSFFVVFRERGAPRPGEAPNFEPSQLLVELKGPWELSFDPRWGGPEKVIFAELEDWAQRPEPGIKFYSGLATYRKEFDLPPSRSARAKSRILLDLGTVKNLAHVHLNGRDLGVVWCAPWQVDVTGSIKASGNQLEITVANLWPNRLVGDSGLPEAQRLTRTTWNPFKPGTALLESGLRGPVTIQEEARGR
ncbi:MAG TPA: glycosyl hydrolase [Verrucomicrobiae bacterium]